VIERERLLQLAKTLPTIWHDETVDMQTKQRVVRILVEEIIADVDLENGQGILLVHWAGGRHSEIRAKRRRPDEHRLKTSRETSEVIRRMGAYWDDRRIAITLNRLGMKTATGPITIRKLIEAKNPCSRTNRPLRSLANTRGCVDRTEGPRSRGGEEGSASTETPKGHLHPNIPTL
jgi:hypothetical protein